MAKRQKEFHYEVNGPYIDIWSDHITCDNVKSIEGVVRAYSQSPVVIVVDPRYSIRDVLKEIKVIHEES